MDQAADYDAKENQGKIICVRTCESVASAEAKGDLNMELREEEWS
jgi:hypothetical protein